MQRATIPDDAFGFVGARCPARGVLRAFFFCLFYKKEAGPMLRFVMLSHVLEPTAEWWGWGAPRSRASLRWAPQIQSSLASLGTGFNAFQCCVALFIFIR